jgi:hypothetical protein
LHPGLVKTDLVDFGVEIYPDLAAMPTITPEESVKGYLNMVDTVERTEDGPKLVCWDGRVLPW